MKAADEKALREILNAHQDILFEHNTAMEQYGVFASAHEGYAVLLEEVDELWDEVKKKPIERNLDKMRKEAAQIGAMALHFMVSICGEPQEKEAKD